MRSVALISLFLPTGLHEVSDVCVVRNVPRVGDPTIVESKNVGATDGSAALVMRMLIQRLYN